MICIDAWPLVPAPLRAKLVAMVQEGAGSNPVVPPPAFAGAACEKSEESEISPVPPGVRGCGLKTQGIP